MGKAIPLVLVAVALAGAENAAAQSAADTRTAIYGTVKPGDRLTVTATDGSEVRGRLLVVRANALVLREADGERAFRYDDIDRVRRRKNGIAAALSPGRLPGAVFFPASSAGVVARVVRVDAIMTARGTTTGRTVRRNRRAG